MKKGMNQPSRGDARNRAILEQQSLSGGRHRGDPVIGDANRTKQDNNQRMREKRLQALIETIREKIGIHPQTEWCEVLMTVAERNKIALEDQILIAQDVYEEHTKSKVADEFLGLSQKIQWYNEQIHKHYGVIKMQKQQASDFHSFLGEL